jgi:hypothetical protein
MIVTKRKLNTAISNDNKKTKLITDYWLPLSVTQSYSSSSSSSSSSSPSEEKRYSVDEITPTLLETWKISTKHVEDIHWFFTHRWLQVKEEEGIFLRKHVHVSRKHVHDFLDGTLRSGDQLHAQSRQRTKNLLHKHVTIGIQITGYHLKKRGTKTIAKKKYLVGIENHCLANEKIIICHFFIYNIQQ